MLARYKCNEIKEAAISQVESDIYQLNEDASGALMDNFRTKCENIVKKAQGKNILMT